MHNLEDHIHMQLLIEFKVYLNKFLDKVCFYECYLIIQFETIFFTGFANK